jgi:hypothetical protein
MLAAANGRLDVVVYLVKHGASVFQVCVGVYGCRVCVGVILLMRKAPSHNCNITVIPVSYNGLLT